MAEKNRLALAILLCLIPLTACGPRRLVLPSGQGTPAADYSSVFASARAECESVRVLQVQLGLSGRAGGQRIRGRVLAGLVPGALRLEGVAPFGSPVFILTAEGTRGTLLLLRDRRVLEGAPPEDILDALVGIRLGPDDLRALLSGCVRDSAHAEAGRAYGPDWMVVDLESGGAVYLRRQRGVWQAVAGRHAGLEVDYTAFVDGRPSRLALRGTNLNLTLALDQVEVNGEMPRDQLVAITMPPGLSPLTLEELRRAGPLGP